MAKRRPAPRSTARKSAARKSASGAKVSSRKSAGKKAATKTRPAMKAKAVKKSSAPKRKAVVKAAPARKSARKAAPAAPKGSGGPMTVFVSTRKGLWTLVSDKTRTSWRLKGPQFLGTIVNHTVLDERDGKTALCASHTGHLGPTMHRSDDRGKTWTEVTQPPAFPKAPEGKEGRAVGHTFWLTPSNASEPGVWYAGTSPQGLFRSEDGGRTWTGVLGYNDNPDQIKWIGSEKDGTPDGGKLHSILVDPRDANHLYIGMSSGGICESLDRGATWTTLNSGMWGGWPPVKDPESGFDPHHVAQHPLFPDRLYQQNHYGIYRMDRPGSTWDRVGEAMPKEVGDIGFPIVLHPRDPERLWVFPMDGTSVWPRVSPDGKPAAYHSKDGGKSWQRQDKGFPRSQGWFTVKRQAFVADGSNPVGLYLGTTSGEVWLSSDEGKSWVQAAAHLPHIYAVFATPGA